MRGFLPLSVAATSSVAETHLGGHSGPGKALHEHRVLLWGK